MDLNRAKMAEKELKFVRAIITGSLLCTIILICYAIVIQTKWILILIGLFCILFVSRYLITYLSKREKPIVWFLAIAVLNLFIVVPEMYLNITQFRYESGIQFGYPQPTQFTRYVPDEKLFWKFQPSTEGINSLGFRGSEIVTPKPNDVYRILFIGDSCTQQKLNNKDYPSILESLLNSNNIHGTRKYEKANLALAGYSSQQGHVVAELYGSKLEPDLAIVYFGWNDHWLAFGSIDSEKVINTSKTLLSDITSYAYKNMKILQMVRMILDSIANTNKPLNEVRVPIDQYKNNLLKISKIFDKENVPIIFITAPTSFYKSGVPDFYIYENQAIPNKEFAIMMHKKYNQVVRDTVRETGSILLDLEAIFNSKKNINDYIEKDGIHFTNLGHEFVSKLLSDLMEINFIMKNLNEVEKQS